MCMNRSPACCLAGTNGKPRAPPQKFTHKHKLLGSVQFSFGRPLRHTVFWPGLIRFKYYLCILHVPNELLLSKVTRFKHHQKTKSHLEQQARQAPLMLVPAIHLILFCRDFQWPEVRSLCNFLTFQLITKSETRLNKMKPTACWELEHNGIGSFLICKLTEYLEATQHTSTGFLTFTPWQKKQSY